MADDFTRITKPKKPAHFTEAMKKELKEIYHLYSYEELAKRFNTTPTKVKAQGQRLYLSKVNKN